MTDVPVKWRGAAGRRSRAPGYARRADVEGPIQSAIVQRLRFELPGAIVHHSPNEIPLSGGDVGRAIGKAKRAGMVPGWPDIVVVLACRAQTVFFEVKAPGGREQASQRALRESATAAGHCWAVVRSQEEAVACLDQWGIARRSKVST